MTSLFNNPLTGAVTLKMLFNKNIICDENTLMGTSAQVLLMIPKKLTENIAGKLINLGSK
jgi:hypothetical protein